MQALVNLLSKDEARYVEIGDALYPLNLPKGTTLSELAGELGMDDLLPPELTILKPLIPPDVPGVDEYFDVNVTLAASPSNFTVIVQFFLNSNLTNCLN